MSVIARMLKRRRVKQDISVECRGRGMRMPSLSAPKLHKCFYPKLAAEEKREIKTGLLRMLLNINAHRNINLHCNFILY